MIELKFFTTSMVALVLAFLLAMVVNLPFLRRDSISHKGSGKGMIAVRVILIFVIFFVAGGFIYFNIYYHAGETAEEAMKGSETVKVVEVAHGRMFDGPGEDTALVFYPGAKVDAPAYAPLMMALAERGLDVFLPDMPIRMAMFGRGFAADYVDAYDYDTWIMGGHSLGGAMASFFATTRPDKIDGILMLASYPSKPILEDQVLYSVLGTSDGIINWKLYEEDKKNWPKEAKEIKIEGGNHSGFGDYGLQQGDNEAAVSPEVQWDNTVNAVLEMQAEIKAKK